MSRTAIDFQIKNNVGILTFIQPDRGNPMDHIFDGEMCEIATECDENPEVRAILMKAQGKYFSVGADIKWLTRSREELPKLLKNATADLHMAISRFSRGNAPVVISVHGLATGGSVALTAMADFAIAAQSARFYAAFLGIGFVSDASGTYFIPRRVGSRKAAEFLLRNEMWTADQAAQNGLINKVVPDDRLEADSLALAEELARGPTQAYGEMKRLLLSTTDQPLDTQMEMEARAIARVSKTDDSWNAMRAIIAKQKPVFSGR